jgi:hypothetical protein
LVQPSGRKKRAYIQAFEHCQIVVFSHPSRFPPTSDSLISLKSTLEPWFKKMEEIQ